MNYIIMRQEFEYNDEIMFATEGGTPIRIYHDKPKAEQELLKLEITNWRGLELSHYCYDLYELNLTSAFMNKYGKNKHGIIMPKEISLEEMKFIRQNCSLRFYYMIEMETSP